MQAYPGYIENGKIIPIGNPALPDGYKAIITILDETVSTDTCRERQLRALRVFMESGSSLKNLLNIFKKLRRIAGNAPLTKPL
jgi:hypothetical protein